ncbi:MAG: rRNA (cytidine1402-2-O)-methyltransferase [Acidimicrobiaceae bacterium]
MSEPSPPDDGVDSEPTRRGKRQRRAAVGGAVGEHDHEHGSLVLVATPIGNLGDLSPRAADELRDADAICCEDSRRTGKLLELAGIARSSPLLVVNDHTESSRVGDVLARLARGERVVVVTDAGTPGISDPGEQLVRAAAAEGHRVEVVPGPSAAIAALVASGLPAARFVFEGFLPRKGSGRTARLQELASEKRTAILYEAPHRVARTLADLSEVCGPDRRVAVARELTKLHEEVWRGTLQRGCEWAAEKEPKGELVLVLEGAAAPETATDDDVVDALRRALDRGVSTKDSVTTVARALGVPKRRVYSLATALDR